MVQLVHLSLEQKHSEILEHCQMMRKLFSDLRCSQLETLSFQECLRRARESFMHIPVAYQSDSLKEFISRSLKYLSPNLVLNIPKEMRVKVNTYVEALSDGRLSKDESEIVVRGSVLGRQTQQGKGLRLHH